MAGITMQAVYEQYKNDVYTYLLSLTRNKSLTEDLTSEVFLSALQALGTYRGDSSIKTWLFSIARYQWYGHLRKIKKTLEREDLLEAYLCDAPRPEASVITKDLVNRMYALLEREPEKNRDVVLMRIDGYSYFEIAQKHAISESSARVLDFRTKGRIRDILLKEGYTSDEDIL